MAGISIDFAADVTKFIGKTKDIEGALEKVSGSLDDMAREAQRSGDKAAEGLDQITADGAVAELRELAAEAKASGSKLELVYSAAADEVEASMKAMATKAEDRLEEISDAAKDVGKDLDKHLSDGAKDAESAAEKLEATFKGAFDKVKGDAKNAGDSVGDDTERGMRKAAQATDNFKNEAKANLSESVSSFRGDLEDIPQIAQDILGGVIPDLGAVGAGVAAAGAAAIGIAVQQMQNLADKINESKEKMGELVLTFAEAGEGMESVDFVDQMRDWAIEIQDARSWFELWQEDAVNNFENVQRASKEAGVDIRDFWQALTSADPSEAFDYIDTLIEKRDTLNQQASDILDNQTVVSQADRDAAMALEDQSAAYNDLINELKPAIEERKKAYDQSVALRAAERDVTEEYIRQEDKINANNAAIEESNKLKNEAIDLAGDAFLAEGEYSLAVAENTAQIAENNKKIADANTGELDRQKLLHENKEAVVAIAADTRTYAQTLADSGASQKDVNAALVNGRDAFLKAAEAAGIGSTEAAELATSLGLIPGSVTTTVKTQTEQAMADLAILAREIRNLPDKTVRITTTHADGSVRSSTAQMNSGGVARRAASGTYVTGEGSDIEDLVPYMLSPGEGVLDKQAMDQLGGPGILDLLNNGQGLAQGSRTPAAPTPPTPQTVQHITINYPVAEPQSRAINRATQYAGNLGE